LQLVVGETDRIKVLEGEEGTPPPPLPEIHDLTVFQYSQNGRM